MPPGIKPLDMAWQRGEQAMKAIRAEEDKIVASICRQRDNFERLLVDEMMEHAKTKGALEAEREARQVAEEALRLERQKTGVDQEKIKIDIQELFERAGNIHKLLGLPPASEPAAITADTPVEEARPTERVDANPGHVDSPLPGQSSPRVQRIKTEHETQTQPKTPEKRIIIVPRTAPAGESTLKRKRSKPVPTRLSLIANRPPPSYPLRFPLTPDSSAAAVRNTPEQSRRVHTSIAPASVPPIPRSTLQNPEGSASRSHGDLKKHPTRKNPIRGGASKNASGSGLYPTIAAYSSESYVESSESGDEVESSEPGD
ncbi:hypothetical protein B0H13DRAFT_2011109 [Mycena leptocephala]|nr:hypothetical protein B0H13DRAFT_2011109 [Mycena leptocephala]